MSSPKPLRIVHVFRAPLGGLFRHVIDLAVEQASRGHQIGLFFDSAGDCERVHQAIARIPGGARLGVAMTPIHRNPHPTDLSALRALARYLAAARPDVVHGHGSKGGLYARLARRGRREGRPLRAYTPHGGSFNYRQGTWLHAAYMWVERRLALRTDVFLFESDHIRQKYDHFVGVEHGVRRVVVNGLGPAEFAKADPPADAADFLYVGELRAAKGVDTLLEALALAGAGNDRPPSAVLVGSGPDREALVARAAKLGLSERVRFPGPLPTREAFALGRTMIVPSRAESMPYVVLEGAAAALPMIATNVGGIPEIFGPFAHRLIEPNDPATLAAHMREELQRPTEERARLAEELAGFVEARFSLENMVETVLSAYREASALLNLGAEPGKAAAQQRSGMVSEA